MNHPIGQVLSVENHPEVGKLMRLVLEEANIGFTLVRTAALGWKLAHEKKFDLILLDGSGFELCRRLKQDDGLKAIPVVFVSGQAQPEYELEALNSGAVGFISKPFGPEEFKARILAYLHRARNERGNP
ncbi:MAG: response regulator [Verrucomicrobia bacterium]|nr:response regulator [Verrucomicrobiota bacterium]